MNETVTLRLRPEVADAVRSASLARLVSPGRLVADLVERCLPDYVADELRRDLARLSEIEGRSDATNTAPAGRRVRFPAPLQIKKDSERQPRALPSGVGTPDLNSCSYRTRGLLNPRGVREAARHYVGKESNLADEVEAGEVTDPAEVLTDLGDDSWETLVLPVVRAMGYEEAERRSGVRWRRLAARTRSEAPRPDAAARLARAAAAWATEQLDAWGLHQARSKGKVLLTPESSLAVLAAYLAEALEHQSPCACADGPEHPPARPGSPYCSERCRQRALKRRQRARTKPAGDAGPTQQPEDT